MNRTIKASTLAIAVLAFYVQSSAQTENAPLLSDDDKAAIIKTAIDLWFSRAEKLPTAEGAELLKYNTLVTEDMSSTLVARLSGLNLVLLKSKQIEKLAHRSTPVRYLRVGGFISTGKTIAQDLSATGRVNDTTLAGHSYHYLFERIDGRWKGKLTRIIC